MSQLDQQYKLPDGRWLGYDERGPAGGAPLFYFHGAPSSRLEAGLYIKESMLQSLNIRLIAVDRPGIGLSSFKANRSLVDFSQDVLALADYLKIGRFSALAYSLGGPYGAACAVAAPERLASVGIVSGAALFSMPELAQNINAGTRRFLNLSREQPWLARLFLAMLAALARFAPDRLAAQADALLPPPDAKIMHSDREFQSGFIRMVRQAMHQGTLGAYHESLLSSADWGFRPQDIHTPVLLWHGQADRNIPVEMASYLASALPQCQAQFYPAEGHLSAFKKYAEKILQALVVTPAV